MPPSRTSDDIPKFMNRFTNALLALFKLTGWQPLLVLLLALTIRVVYNLFFFQHRICDIGDSSYYLTAGKALADLIRASWSETHLSDFLVRLCQPTTVIPGSFQSFSSTNLSDRLLLDGPIFPSYLAGLFLLIGTQTGAAANLALNAHSQFYAIANSVVDSFSCLLVCAFTSLAFGRKTGLLAGIGLALYAPSIINTQQCYGEPFAYFLLCCWTLLLVLLSCAGSSGKLRFLNYFFLALFSGLLMLAKPAFVFLPWLGIAVHLAALAIYKGGRKPVDGSIDGQVVAAASKNRSLLSTFALPLLTFAMGLAVALAPWLGFTRSVSGQTMLVVNRAPQYNLYIGNYLATDGWKTWPTQPNIPNTMADAKAFVMDEFKSSPLALVGLFLRKIARLTVGVWNEFQYPIGIFTIVEQNIWQGVLLLLSCLGLAAILGKKEWPSAAEDSLGTPAAASVVGENNSAKALALSFAAVILFHLIYACFEPVPRYAITAMPLVMAFAAQGLLTVYGAITHSKSLLQRASVLLLVALVLCGFSCLYRFVSFVPQLVWFFPVGSFEQIRIFAALLWCSYFVLIFVLLGQFLKLIGASSKSSLACLALAASLTISSTAAFYLQDPALRECSTLLVPGGVAVDANLALAAEVTQSVPYPAAELQREGLAAPYSFVLIDCESTAPPPVLAVAVNGSSLPPQSALMWNELLPAEKDVPVILDLQSRAMSMDKRLLRQWWAVCIPTKCLKENDENEVTLSVPAGFASVRIFADFKDAKSTTPLLIPSLNKFSWTKGFLTYDHRDARPYEVGPLTPLISPEPKHLAVKIEQKYRVQLACPCLKKQETARENLTQVLFTHSREQVVNGADPRTFNLSEPVSTDHLAASMRFDFSFEVGKSKTTRPVEVDLAFSGTKAGQPITWRSQWQPASIEADPDWKKYTYSSLLPAGFDRWRNITCTVSMSPFIADQLYLHPKEAQRAQMTVRNLRVELSPSGIPSGEFRWVLH
ncbi:MAG: hypothetical protein Q8T09_20695 [Candidatus Melainabacteria bacterium]|nr:hypothetical protein [Candidatus Melainabacteria bacterium]